MKKKMIIAIIMSALVLGSFAGCSTQETQTSTYNAETANVQNLKNTDDIEYSATKNIYKCVYVR